MNSKHYFVPVLLKAIPFIASFTFLINTVNANDLKSGDMHYINTVERKSHFVKNS